MEEKTRQKIESGAFQTKKDVDGNFYNVQLISVTEAIVTESQKIIEYKSFQYEKFYEKRFY